MEAIWQFLVKGGITMIPLGLCSIVGLAVVIEKAISLRTKRILIPEVMAVAENLTSPKDATLVLAVCEKHSGPLPNIIRTALVHRNLPREEMKELIIDQGRQEVRVLERGLITLETVAAISPLLGLFGTVLGIFKLFEVIGRIGVGHVTEVSGGIAEAIITTIAGLAIGIPALVAFNYFTSRAENLVLDIERCTSELLLKLKHFEADRAIS
ncbi:MAG: MotA/TolQ/ExbB proton channel family protein [candidate division KSB1 bacterium]